MRHLSELVWGNENVRRPAEVSREGELTPSSPPPLPDGHASGAWPVVASSAEDSNKPTLRPPAPPVSGQLSPAFAGPSETEAAERRGTGFTSVIRHLSLRGWLRWIHSNRSDATLRVRTREGGSGYIWCSGGRIVDAEWGELTADDALAEMLVLASGAVTIDFDPVDRGHRVMKPTHEVLHVEEDAPGRLTDTVQAEEALAASPTGSVCAEPFRNTMFLPIGSAPPAAQTIVPRSPSDPRRTSRGAYLAGAGLLAALAVAAFAFGRTRASSQAVLASAPEPVPAEQAKSGLRPPPVASNTQTEEPTLTPKALDLPLIPFVALEVEPPRAEIWLDQELIGLGRIQLAAVRDGMLHELRFVASGHETKILFFRDTPPAGRVILPRISEQAPANGAIGRDTAAGDTSESDSAESDSPEGDVVDNDEANDGEGRAKAKRVSRRRAAPAPARARPPVVEDPPAIVKPTQARKSPQVQLIEVHTPRVQVLD